MMEAMLSHALAWVLGVICGLVFSIWAIGR